MPAARPDHARSSTGPTTPTTPADLLAGPPPALELDAAGRPVDPLLVVAAADVAALGPGARREVLERLRGTRRFVVAVGPGQVPGDLAAVVDVALASGTAPVRAAHVVPVPDLAAAVDLLRQRFASTPTAALTYAWLLRQSAGLPVPAALAAESAAYSTLLAGPEFAAWRSDRAARRTPRPADDRDDRVLVRRTGDVLHLQLHRPHRRNALDAAMRDALREALAVAEWDIATVVELSGAGADFCSGGDLDEFGTARDPAGAHVLRLATSLAEVLARLRDRVTVHLHGSCLGAGLELPSFAGRVLATTDVRLGLPELSMGLIPGAGGTVGITRRIGRWRTAWLGLTGLPVDAATALAWGLVDEVRDAAPRGGPPGG